MSNVEKSRLNLSNRRVFLLYFLIFYVFLLLKGYFFIQQPTSTFFNVIKVCFPGFTDDRWELVLFSGA